MTSEIIISDLQRHIARLDNRCRKCNMKRGAFACEAECKQTVNANREILKSRIEVARRV